MKKLKNKYRNDRKIKFNLKFQYRKGKNLHQRYTKQAATRCHRIQETKIIIIVIIKKLHSSFKMSRASSMISRVTILGTECKIRYVTLRYATIR